jgi:hypothetical protein
MTMKRIIRISLVAVAAGALPVAAFADEIVHFTNGAEMTVRSHSIEKSKQMVQLDLGGNSYISFPMSMVEKIVSAGKDVYVNGVFRPSNQAIAGVPGSAVADNSVHGMETGGFRRGSLVKDNKGTNLGEATNAIPIPASGQIPDNAVINSRRIFNPAVPAQPGSSPQVIMPPGAPHRPVQMALKPASPAQSAPPPPAPANPPSNEAQENPPASDPAPEDPPDTP